MKRIHFEAHLNQFVKLPEALTDDLLKSRYDYCLLGSHKWCPSYENSNQVSFAWFDLKKPVVFAVHVHFILLMLELLSLFPYTGEIKERFDSWQLPAAGGAAHPTLSSPSHIAPDISLMCVFNPPTNQNYYQPQDFPLVCAHEWFCCFFKDCDKNPVSLGALSQTHLLKQLFKHV